MDLGPRFWKIKLEEARQLWARIELCLCCPYGNAVCESFISYLRVVKTDWRNRLNESNLTDLMRIKVTGPTLHVFRERFGELAVDLWNSDKSRRKTQGKRKQYAPRGSASKRTRETEREEFLRDWLKDVGAEDEEKSESEENEEEMEADVSEEDALEPSQKKPPVHSAQWELSDCSEDSDREDPFLGGMRSSDSDSD